MPVPGVERGAGLKRQMQIEDVPAEGAAPPTRPQLCKELSAVQEQASTCSVALKISLRISTRCRSSVQSRPTSRKAAMAWRQPLTCQVLALAPQNLCATAEARSPIASIRLLLQAI